jgi:hypothetical protein
VIPISVNPTVWLIDAFGLASGSVRGVWAAADAAVRSEAPRSIPLFR